MRKSGEFLDNAIDTMEIPNYDVIKRCLSLVLIQTLEKTEFISQDFNLKG